MPEGYAKSTARTIREIGRLSAEYVQKVLAGAEPADLRAETVDKSSLAINLRTAKELGLSIPPAMLARAGRVIRCSDQ